MSDNVFVRLYIEAKAKLGIKQTIEEVAKETGVKTDYIISMIGIDKELSEENGKLTVNEKDSKTKKRDIINYLEDNTKVYKYEIPIALGIDVNFVNEMIKNGELFETNGMIMKASKNKDTKTNKTIIRDEQDIKIDLIITDKHEKFLKYSDKVIRRKNANGEEFRRGLQNFNTKYIDKQIKDGKPRIRGDLRKTPGNKEGCSR